MFLSTSIFSIALFNSTIASLIFTISSDRLLIPFLLVSISRCKSSFNTDIEVLILLISTFSSSIASVLDSYSLIKYRAQSRASFTVLMPSATSLVQVHFCSIYYTRSFCSSMVPLMFPHNRLYSSAIPKFFLTLAFSSSVLYSPKQLFLKRGIGSHFIGLPFYHKALYLRYLPKCKQTVSFQFNNCYLINS